MSEPSDGNSQSKDGNGDDKRVDNNKLKAIKYIRSQVQLAQNSLSNWSPSSGVEITSGLPDIWKSPVAETYSSKISGAVSGAESLVTGIATDLDNAASQQEQDPGEKLEPGKHPTEENWKTEP